MGIDVKKEKQYILLSVKDEILGPEFCEEMKNTISEQMEKGAKNFIMNLKGVKEAGPDFYASLDTVMNMLLKEEGMMVITGARKGEISTFIENKGIIATRTMDEAVDYVFMEEIEKQLQSDNDDDLDDF